MQSKAPRRCDNCKKNGLEKVDRLIHLLQDSLSWDELQSILCEDAETTCLYVHAAPQ
jgi:hypothetical protein